MRGGRGKTTAKKSSEQRQNKKAGDATGITSTILVTESNKLIKKGPITAAFIDFLWPLGGSGAQDGDIITL